jgi:hypothetical protein
MKQMTTPDQNSGDEFGFRANAVRDKLRNIRPSVPPTAITDMATVDAAAERAGFISRERAEQPPPEYPSYRAPSAAPQAVLLPINMRVPDTVAAVFKGFCKDNRYSYPAGLEEIMKRAGMLKP